AGFDALDGIGLDRLESAFALLVPGQLRDIHRLVGIHHIGRRQLDAISGGDAVIDAGLFVVHAVGIAAQGIIERDVILMLADALLATVLGERVFGVEIAPVAIAAQKPRRG